MRTEQEVSAYDLTRQARWEVEGYRRAEEAYKEAAAAKSISELPSGQRLLREIIPPLDAAILRLQAEAEGAIGTVGSTPGWAYPVLALPSDAQAFITVVSMLAAIRATEDGPENSIVGVASEISAGARTEIAYRAWVAEQEGKDGPDRLLLARFRRTYPDPKPASWRRWARKVRATVQERWSAETQLQYGCALMRQAFDVAPRYLKMEHVGQFGGRSLAIVALTEEAVAVMADTDQRRALSRPRLMPMLIPPRPWAYID